MKPIKYKDSGSAVEDIQRRLRVLGYAIGPEGSSGAFLDNTLVAVSAFQRAHGIEPTGSVGPRTWSTLVDSTFELGDRMLYLRMPYFHGADVTQLQRALNSLGFVTGGADGIFGANTERAVTEFQQNYDINPDGFVGNNTLRALSDLRHIWGSKEGIAHSSAQGSPRKHYLALLDYYFDFQVDFHLGEQDSDPGVQAALRRIVRYANNLEDAARTDILKESTPTALTTVLVTVTTGTPEEITIDTLEEAPTGTRSFLYQSDIKVFAADLCTGLVELEQESRADADHSLAQSLPAYQIPAYELHVVVPSELLQPGSETSLPPALQMTAALLLDALCLAATS